VVLTIVSATISAAGQPASASRYEQTRTRIAPGIWYTKIHDTQGPNEMRLLTVDPSRAPEIGVATGGGRRLGLDLLTHIASAGDAIAAVNGDFFVGSGGLFHPFQRDGQLYESGWQEGWSFRMSSTEEPSIARPEVAISAAAPDGTWPVDAWNEGRPGWGEVVGYSGAATGIAPPPDGACAARLFPTSDRRWTGGGRLQRDYRVGEARCADAPLPLMGGLVLASRRAGAGADDLRALAQGDRVTLTWTVGGARSVDAIGGMPLLVDQGQNVVRSCWSANFCGVNPRTGVGITADGRVLLLTVDGRRADWSVGMTMSEFAQQFVRLGATRALNLDGGGSTTVVVRGTVRNRPAYGAQREIASAIVVHR
jgi:exopolysaccharide biosynthesis protein